MSKIAIQPTSLPLGLGTANYMEIVVNYSIGDESTDLQIFYYDNLVKLNVSPQVIPVPVSEMQTWGYDFSQIVEWVANQTGAEFPE
ncbi:MAG: hypothetical protein ACK5XN_10515 [Bacteroidota bacterium]|jgi:hypothetical protein